jgi:hypothetical protein
MEGIEEVDPNKVGLIRSVLKWMSSIVLAFISSITSQKNIKFSNNGVLLTQELNRKGRSSLNQ